MPCRLILNADDFGLTPGINQAVEELHRASALTSATLMASGPAFADAVAVSARNPSLGVGCHVVLVDGTPRCPPRDIPSLIAGNGHTFRETLPDFAQALLRGVIRKADLIREIDAQVRALQHAGIKVTHLDTHKHTHIFPPVTSALLHVAKALGIPAIRNPFEPPWAMSLGRGTPLRRSQIHLLRHAFEKRFLQNVKADKHVATTAGTFGISATGLLNANTLKDLLAALPASGTWECVTHPGYPDHALNGIRTRLRETRNIERKALLACLPTIRRQRPDIQFISFAAAARASPDR